MITLIGSILYYYIIKLKEKMRTTPTKDGNGTYIGQLDLAYAINVLSLKKQGRASQFISGHQILGSVY
jgi:hypothetical protein